MRNMRKRVQNRSETHLLQLLDDLEHLTPSSIEKDHPFTTAHWDSNIQSITKIKAIFDYLNRVSLLPPVGFVYTQYPQKQEPSELWTGCEWKEITADYEGAFFRAEGGPSLAFNAGRQEDSAPNITGQLGNVSNYHQAINGAFAAYNEYTYAGGKNKLKTVDFYASRSSASYGRRNEVAPINFSIKIWERIA